MGTINVTFITNPSVNHAWKGKTDQREGVNSRIENNAVRAMKIRETEMTTTNEKVIE